MMWRTVDQLLAGIGEKIRALQEAAHAEEISMAQLKEQGLIYAGTWMKAEKYLYLVYPSDGLGSRKREYIGADPQAIQIALDGIQRGKDYDQAKARRDRLHRHISTITRQLTEVHRVAESDPHRVHW